MRARVTELEVHSKGTQDLVTEADLEVELLLKRELARRFPDDAFFGEETGAAALDSARGVWVADPIDGTQPFVSGMVACTRAWPAARKAKRINSKGSWNVFFIIVIIGLD